MYKWKQWEMTTLTPIDAESQDLKTHVDICAYRYRELDTRLTNLESKIDGIGLKVDGFRAEMKKTIIVTSGSVVVAVITTLGVILSKMI